MLPAVPSVIPSTPVSVGASTSTAGMEPPLSQSFSAVVSGSSVISPVLVGTVAVQAPASVNSSAPAVLAKPSSVPASIVVLAEVAGVVDTLITSVVSTGAQEPSPIVDRTTVSIPVDEDESYFNAPFPPVATSPTLVGRKHACSRA